MTLERRDFLLLGSGLVAAGACGGASPGANGADTAASQAGAASATATPGNRWDLIRDEFAIDPAYMNFAGFKLTPHPRVVREAIEAHRRRLDENPILYLKQRGKLDRRVRAAAAGFIGGAPGDICLTDSTTMGLGLCYGGFLLRPGQDIVSTTHDHYATSESLRSRASRDGAQLRQVTLYDHGSRATESEMVGRLMAAVTAKTRVVAITWVHSSTGVKLPLRAIADALAEHNRGRDDKDRALLCVDGVHGLGVENFTVADLGCDFFIAGTHKWLFGPRGTGIVWARPSQWHNVLPMIPPFETAGFRAAKKRQAPPRLPGGVMTTPGGYHSFEHRWALAEAFGFQNRIGRARIEQRIRDLNTQLKEGLRAMKHVELYTPMASDLSAGFAMFDVAGMSPKEVVARLLDRDILASTTPYRPSYARLAPGLLNNEAEVDAALRAVGQLGQA